METKEIKIIPPEGYVIDKENSTFECIKFKPKGLTYEDIAKKLFEEGNYHTNINGDIYYTEDSYNAPNSSSSYKQLQKMLAINKLMNVAKYLNGNWKPDWNNKKERKYFIFEADNRIGVDFNVCNTLVGPYFKMRRYAQQAIDILGEDTIRLALSTDW